ncbi:merR family transcriptional regulator [Planomonospora sphaerica]|uniref:MerR family transcriptional regulator n=1 Tax=Planomonospora sphaerica TaxID=161355 RepID=A0A161LUP9_9ACTN|nr:MerR family transcriptional regulator [Planomonospora sphaerica]GAT65371.1 merR family transcriptional regulator [Planomonospora sphaerica]
MTAEDGPDYGIGAVARRLGVPAPTLRTWNLRYGVGPSRRSPGGHRRYDTADLRRLEEMNRLIRSGVPAADAARHVLEDRSGPAAARPATGREEIPAKDAGTAASAVGSAPESTAGTVAGPAPETAAGTPSPATGPEGGPQVPTPAMLARAAVALDGEAVSDWIGAALARHGVLWTWEQLVLPVFAAVSRRQLETGAAVEVEHLFSDRLAAALAPLTRRPRTPVNERPVLLACAEEEQHSLPLHALAAVLSLDHGVETRVLGARTPYSALADAMRRLGPAVVFVWSHQASTGDPSPLAALPSLRPPARVLAGGPGWRDGLPPSVPHVTSFRDALTRISAALHPSPGPH